MRRWVLLVQVFLLLPLLSVLLSTTRPAVAEEPPLVPSRCTCADGKPLMYQANRDGSPYIGFLMQVDLWQMAGQGSCYEGCLRACGCDPAEPDLEKCSYSCIIGPLSTKPATGKLKLDISLGEGQRFIQADDLLIQGVVYRDDRTRGATPTSGACVTVNLTSPSGKVSTTKLTSTSSALANFSWPTYFTADAAPGIWTINTKATPGSDSVTLTRRIVLEALTVTSGTVTSNLAEIARRWQATPEVPRGVDRPFIAALWYPKGVKVDLHSWIDKRFLPYQCTALAIDTLKFLNSIRFSASRADRMLMAGVDYGPISDVSSLIHVSVALYPHDGGIEEGSVLEPWWNQDKEVWTYASWTRLFGRNSAWIGFGDYPTNGSATYQPGPMEAARAVDMMAVLSYSPVDLLVTDSRGRQVGRTADGSRVNEIPDANHLHVTNDDGTFVNLIYLPTGTYQVAATGTADGTFHLATATQAAIVNYGEQPIGAGQTATLVLTKGQDQPLRLPDGSQVQPDPGFIESESGLLDALGRYGPIAGMVVGALLVVVSASLLTRRFVRAKRPPTSSPPAPRTYPPPAAPGVVCPRCGLVNDPRATACGSCRLLLQGARRRPGRG
ncbi:MAG: hypothetical protein IPO80_07430 [Propionibacteriaceae bacterium]|nr:hypothetical protein [Propionibacteriaceae bacterium]